MKNILVPVDFSRCSRRAADIAIDMALRANASIYLLHLHSGDPRNFSDTDNNQHEADLDVARTSMSILVDRAEKAGVRATPLVVVASAREWVETYVKAYSIDLVVMGSHGISGTKPPRMGSIALEFARIIENTPVLIIRESDAEFNLRKIVFASDFKIGSIKPFEIILELAALYEATIDLLYVVTPYHFVSTREVSDNMKRFMHEFKRINYISHVYNAVDEETGIEEFAKYNPVDLIAMTTRGRSGFMKRITPSIAEDVFRHEQIPLLLINIGSSI